MTVESLTDAQQLPPCLALHSLLYTSSVPCVRHIWPCCCKSAEAVVKNASETTEGLFCRSAMDVVKVANETIQVLINMRLVAAGLQWILSRLQVKQ